MRRTKQLSTIRLVVVVGAALLLSTTAFAQHEGSGWVTGSEADAQGQLRFAKLPQTVDVGDGEGNFWDENSLARPESAADARAMRIARSEIAEYMVRLSLHSEAEIVEAMALGVPTPHLGTEVYDVTPDVLENLKAAGVRFAMVGGVTEFTVVPADVAQPPLDGMPIISAGYQPVQLGESASYDGDSESGLEISEKAAGIVNTGTNTPYTIPDSGSRTLAFPVSEGIGAEVTDFEYRLRIHNSGTAEFWCLDYEILFGSSQSGGYTMVYNNLGPWGETDDGGYDDDAEDDDDIYLNWRSLSAFNGQDLDQTYYIQVRDTLADGDGTLQYVQLKIYWETDPAAPGDGDFAAVDVCGVTPGDTGFNCVASFAEGSSVWATLKMTYSGSSAATAQHALQLDNGPVAVSAPISFMGGSALYMPVSGLSVGSHRIRGWCDYNGAVNESNEGNNFRDEAAAFEVTSGGGGGCSYSISPGQTMFPAGGGSAAVTVTTTSGCSWSASSNASWITITAGSSGSGSGQVIFTVAANGGAARSGTMTIAGQTHTVNQDGGGGGCTFSISPSTASYSSGGGSGSVAVTAGSGCAWSASSNAGWVTITSGFNGTGNGAVGYSVSANSGGARTGTLTVAGQTFTVNQAGSGGGGGTCTPNATTLCLNNDRFQVQVNWATNQPSSGVGQGVELTADTGYFTFFNPSNVEMVIKVLNGCGVNNHYWVFAGGLTNVQVSMTVTDTANGTTKTYNNPMGTNFQPIQDTGAFATCP